MQLLDGMIIAGYVSDCFGVIPGYQNCFIYSLAYSVEASMSIQFHLSLMGQGLPWQRSSSSDAIV